MSSLDSLPSQTKVVIVGGGVIGTSVAYHLAKLGWQDIEIRRRKSGEPFVLLHGKGAELLAARGARRLHVSLTHTENYAAATARLEG